MAHIAGTNGGVYTGVALLIEDCELAWDEAAYTGCTSGQITGKVGTYAARVTTAAGALANQILMSHQITKDASTYHAAFWWVRASVTAAAGDLALLLDETAACASPDETLYIPALTAATWKQCFGVFTGATSTRNALISIGLKQITDMGLGEFDVDDVEAVKEMTGVKSWTLDYTASVVDTTDFGDTGTRTLLPGVSQWAGSFEGYKDGVPLAIGSEYYLVLGESNTAYQGWVGKAVITSANPVTSFDGSVNYAYSFEGTAGLETPSA